MTATGRAAAWVSLDDDAAWRLSVEFRGGRRAFCCLAAVTSSSPLHYVFAAEEGFGDGGWLWPLPQELAELRLPTPALALRCGDFEAVPWDDWEALCAPPIEEVEEAEEVEDLEVDAAAPPDGSASESESS